MKNNEKGMSLVELIIAVGIIGIGIIVASGAFTLIQKSIQSSKTHTLASNIAQEKMQIIMQKPYYEVLVTTLPSTRTDVTPTVYYDPYNFPPETLTEGGISFTRYTYVQVIQENSGTFQVLAPQTPDTGMRQLTETVVWPSVSGYKSLSLQSVLNNPNTAMASTWFKGIVRSSSTLVGIPGALVVAAENVGWRDTTDNSGNFSINLTPGTFDFAASAPGYFTNVVTVGVPFNGVVNQTFNLVAMASGTVQGTAWIDNHVVISQIVGSSITAAGFRQQFVELYNPTTNYMSVATGGSPNIVLEWEMRGDASPTIWPLTYNVANSSIPPHGYYLIANTTTITMGGLSRAADAQFSSGLANYPNPIRIKMDPSSDGAGLGIAWASNGSWIDRIGWTQDGGGSSNYPPLYEGVPILNFAGGLQDGEQYIRRTTTNSVITASLGRAYDTDTNATDILFAVPALYPVRNSGDNETPVSGTPASGAVISVTDGLSATSSATITGSPPYATFSVPRVATGTWVVFLDSGSYTAEVDSVTVVANSTTSIPNGNTSPAGVGLAAYSSIMLNSGVVGMINGKITDGFGNALSGITINAGANSTTSAATGSYFMRLAIGIYDVVANQGNANTTYASITQTGVNVNMGDVTANVNFFLPQSGRINGFITRDGTNPLPGVAMTATDPFGNAHDTEVSGNDGKFTLINLSTGTYTVAASLDSKETSTPISAAATVVAGATVSAGTFTITGAMGIVTGSVTSGGSPIKSGVLVIISTSSVSFPPPALSSNTLTSAAYYADSSNESGIYSVEVRGSTSTTYNVQACYMHLNNQTPTISTATLTNITVTAGQTTSGVNFSW